MKILHFISRIIVGVVFIFSGIVKGVDPLGMAYRIEDYFIAWDVPGMMPYALLLSILLSTMEFVLGVVVLFNLKPRIGSMILLGVMTFFTGLTFYDALYNPVPDCGCFGDAIKLTNWETFYKNVILMVFTVVIVIWRKKTRDDYSNFRAYGFAGLALAAFVFFSVYCYRHLPLIDFMDWKIGNKMYNDNPLPVKYYLTYRNKETGEMKEYLSPDYPYNDSVWMSKWEFAEQRVEDPNVFKGHDLQIMDTIGNDLTDVIIRNPDYQFILVAWDLEKADPEALTAMSGFAVKAMEAGFGFIGLTSSLPALIDSTRNSLKLSYEIYLADDITLKVMVRANPGLLLMKEGIIVDKWHFNDFPTYDEFGERFLVKATGK